MLKTLPALLLALLSWTAHAEVWQARYGVAETFDFKLYNADGTLDVDEADGGTEVSLSCNEGAETTATNDFVDEGTFYSIALTATEMQCERIAVVVAATTTEVFFIQTIDNASAMTPTIVQTGDSFARLGAPAGASVSADVAAVKTDTAAILVDTGTTLDDLVDDLEARLGTPSNLGGGATVAANLSDIEAQTDDIGAAGAGLTALATQVSVNTIDDFVDTEVAAILAAVDTEVAAILDDTGTSGVLISSSSTNCRAPLGCSATGTLSGTHSATTADLGTNAPGATSDMVGKTLVIPAKYFARAITAYNTGTGVATFASTGLTLADGDVWYLWETSPGSGDVNVTTVEGTDATNYFATLDDTVVGLIGTPSNLGGGATLAANAVDIEAQTDDIGAAGAGLTAADDAVMTRLGAPTGASISADIAGVESGISWNSAWDAEVQSEAADALAAIFLDQLLANTYNPATPPGAADSLLEDLVESDAGVTRFSVNALEQAPSGGGGVADWSADERTAIRSILGIPASGTTPDDPTTGILDTTRDAVAGVQSDTNDIQTRLPAALVSGRMDSSTGAMAANVMTAAAAASDLTTELQSGLATSSAVSALDTKVGTPSNLGSGATLAANNVDVEAQTDDIGVAGAGLTAADDSVLAAIAALNNLSSTQVRDLVIEDQGGGVTLGCALAVLLAYASGDIATSGATTTYEEPSGTETRTTGIVTSNGNRTATITCPTY